MAKITNVLSLFDGLSCGQIALKQLGVIPETYYASEIDKHAIGQTQLNFHNTIQLGSVVDVNVSDLKPIDLLIGGSPCQSFSFAGKMKGMSTKCEKEILSLEQYLELKEQNFEFEGQSYLFWEYVRIYTELRKINSDIKFLLENVLMVEKWERIISKTLEVNPIMINSALVSAQNRKRLYWTNIGMQPAGFFGEMASIIKQPEDKGILLKDILEENVPEKYYLRDKMLKSLQNHSDKKQSEGCGFKFEPTNGDKKANCVTSRVFKMGVDDNYIIAMRGRNPENPKSRESATGCIKFGRTDEAKKIRKQNMQKGVDYTPFTEKTIVDIDFQKMNTITTATSKDNLVMQINPSKESGGKQPYQQNRVYDINGISPALCAHKSDLLIFGCDYRTDEGFRIRENGKSGTLAARARNDESCGQLAVIQSNTTDNRIRRLTPRECGRLQTVPEHLLDKMLSSGISDTQLYKMFGNGWTVSVIAHIFSYLIPYQKDKIIAE